MFALDLPPEPPPYYPTVVIAQVAETRPDKVTSERTVGICHLVASSEQEVGQTLTPVFALRQYFRWIEQTQVSGPSVVTVIEKPKHGELVDEGTFVRDGRGLEEDSVERGYSYRPAYGYVGDDRVILSVEIGGYKVKVIYSMHVSEIVDDDDRKELCPSRYQRISSATPLGIIFSFGESEFPATARHWK